MNVIAYIETDFPEKFGIPRQSGLAKSLTGRIIFEPEYRNAEAVRGLSEFNYIWLLWQFEVANSSGWSPTVRPPRLGGNTHVGVFATRSPYRPNPIGLSSVRLDRIEFTSQGPILYVSGIDLRNHTPIYDIKPYIPYVDCHTDASEGFTETTKDYSLQVIIPPELQELFPPQKYDALAEILRLDPRPSYHNDPTRVYGISFAGFNIRFTVTDQVLTVKTIEQTK